MTASTLTESFVRPTPALSAASEPPAVRIVGLTKRFPVARGWGEALRHPTRRTFATSVNDVTFDVRRGEFFGLLGPNGAGKTTLFKLLSAAVIPDHGTAIVQGHDVVREPRAVRRVLTPVLASERTLNWRLSARENLRLFAALYGLRGAAARDRIEQVLELVQLSDVGEKMLGTYSSGMAQRVSIARAFLSDPSILLLDEPTRSLDPLSARSLRAFLRDEVCKKLGCTVLLATHSADEALSGMCDRVGVLHRGELLALGSPDGLQRRFADDRYQIWTHEPNHPAFAALEAREMLSIQARDTVDEAGWYRVDVRIAGAADRAAAALADLVAAGVPVARFERVELTLAELIERVVATKSLGGVA